MANLKEFWENKTNEDKRKIVVYAIAGAVILLIIIILFAVKGGDKQETVADFENPDAKEVKKYNSRSEASMVGRDSLTANASIDNIFGVTEESEEPADIFSSGSSTSGSTYYEPSYSTVSSGSSGSGASSNSSPSVSNNSHNTYGDYSMWQTSEPENNSISYSTVQPPKGQKIQKTTVKKTEVQEPEQDYFETQVPDSRPLTKEERLQNAIANKYAGNSNASQGAIQVLAEIYNSQKINGSNNSVRIVLKDKIYLKNGTIGTDAFIYGTASVNSDNIVISVPNISYKGKNYQVDLVAYDYRTGELGIPVKNENIIGNVRQEAENQISQNVGGRLGQVGNVISGILSNRNRSLSIQLNDGHRIYLKSRQ